MTDRFTAEELEDKPTLSVAQADNLKFEDLESEPPIRVWLCRCGIADGMPYDNQITVEHCIEGQWTSVDVYPG